MIILTIETIKNYIKNYIFKKLKSHQRRPQIKKVQNTDSFHTCTGFYNMCIYAIRLHKIPEGLILPRWCDMTPV